MIRAQGVVIAMSVFLAIAGNAQIRSAPQKFELDVRTRYQRDFTRHELDRFLRELPWSLEQMQRAERLLAGDAIRMARSFGDYAGLLRLADGELPGFTARMLHLLDGEFRDFWQETTPDTRKLLLDNLEYLAPLLDILAAMADSPESLAYKQRLARYPDALVFLYRFPSLLEVDVDRLPILLHLLRHFSLATENSDALHHLNQLMSEWHRLLIPLYVGTQEEYGPAAAFTLLTAPTFFTQSNNLTEDLRKNHYIWSVLLSQLGFIRERHEQSVNWERDANEIAKLIHRRPSDSRLSPAEWMEFLLHTAPANGKALRLICEMRENADGLATLDQFLLYLRDSKIPFSIMLDLIKFARTSGDLLFMIEIVRAPIYAESGKNLYPLIIMRELSPDSDDNFLRMLKSHQHKLIAYLSNASFGATPTECWALAVRTNLADLDYNESAFRTALRIIPGGNLANVAIKSFSGYPVSKLEWGFAALDVARGVLFVATLGSSEVVAQAGTQAGSEAAIQAGESATQTAAESAIEAAVEKLAESAVERTLWESTKYYAQNALRFALENADAIADYVIRIKSYLDDAANQQRFRQREQELFANDKSNHLTEDAQSLISNRFSHLPLRQPKQQQCTLNAGRLDTVSIRFPESNKDWLERFEGKGRLNPILLLTLGDLK